MSTLDNTATTAAPSSRTRPRRPSPGVARLFNGLALRLAGTRWMPLYGVLEHRGRRSGRLFQTPVVARPTRAGFIVPMPWGETTDWFRNVRAAGRCEMRWNGRTYRLVEPEVIEVGSADGAFAGWQRAAMRRFGIRQAVRLRRQPD